MPLFAGDTVLNGLDGLNNAVLTAFAEPLIYVASDATQHPFDGVFDKQRSDLEAGYSDQYSVEVLSSDATEIGIGKRGKIVREGVTYRVLDIEQDAGGMTTLWMRRDGN